MDTALPFPVCVLVNKNMVRFRNKGDTLARTRADRLLAKDVETGYIQKTDWGRFLCDLENIVEGVDIGKDPETAGQQIRNLFYAYGKELENSRDLQQSFYEKLQLLANKMAQCLTIPLATRLIKRCNDPSVYLSNHSVNVAIFAALIALRLNWDKQRLSKLILGAFIHNIGLIKIPEEIVHKPGPLTPEEWNAIKRHPDLGAELLTAMGSSADIIRIVREHHEQFDGNGYPKGLKKQEISEYVSLIGVADVYDALLSKRPWEQAYISELAIEMMREMTGRFDPKIFQLIGKKK